MGRCSTNFGIILTMKKILFFPGAFNPPHNGHISLVQTALNQFTFDEVWIMPSGRRDDGKIISTNYEDRRSLNVLFTNYLQKTTQIPVVLITDELDDMEDLGTKELIRRIKATPSVDIIQLIGSDAYSSLLKNNLIVDNEKFLIFNRVGHILDFSVRAGDHFFDIELPNISSTMIRAMASDKNEKYKELVPKEIGEYVDSKKLYK